MPLDRHPLSPSSGLQDLQAGRRPGASVNGDTLEGHQEVDTVFLKLAALDNVVSQFSMVGIQCREAQVLVFGSSLRENSSVPSARCRVARLAESPMGYAGVSPSW